MKTPFIDNIFRPVPLLASFLLTLLSTAAQAQTFHHWEGNGHDYAVISLAPGQGWEAAKLDAEARGGYLVTLTSLAENDFVTSIVDDPAYWTSQFGLYNFGPFIGFYHDDGVLPHETGWKWVSGEPTNYTNWDFYSSEPNNGGGHENYAHFHSPGDSRQGLWNDLAPDYPIQPNSYVLERGAPVPEPGTFIALEAGLLSFGRRRRRSRRDGSGPVAWNA